MTAVSAPVQVQRTLPPEEQARGDFYALLARLMYSAPDQALLQALAQAAPIPAEHDAALAKAWQELTLASSVMDADAAGEEYDDLFVGVGKAAVSVYAGFYTGAMAVDHPRIRLQAELAALGLERRAGVAEPEDHLAAVFDVMRVMVAGGAGRAPAPVAEQKRFFERYLKVAAPGFFNAVIENEKANYYCKVAALGLAFTAIESESFELD
jgi:TorA maturation chaperone TorD